MLSLVESRLWFDDSHVTSLLHDRRPEALGWDIPEKPEFNWSHLLKEKVGACSLATLCVVCVPAFKNLIKMYSFDLLANRPAVWKFPRRDRWVCICLQANTFAPS